ncbi:MAG: rhomboid family intramembrane serine protease [Bacteroidetes bacterium]|nr:rhomboid family intramembrane serine protease [Bacteroidota bacterium]
MFSFLNNLPPVTKNFLLINILLYVVMQISIASGAIDLSTLLASHYIGTPFFEPFQMVTHMFMHSPADLMHIFFNMFLLVIFGSNLERLWGPKRFFIFYFAAGIGAFLLDNIVNGLQIQELKQSLESSGISIESIDNLIGQHKMMTEQQLSNQYYEIMKDQSAQTNEAAVKYFQTSLVSGVGASGAIFGLLAAFAILFPNTEMYLMFIPIPIKAKFLIGAYVLYEMYKAFSTQTDNINHLAHLGGALTGAILVLIWRYTDRKNFY